MPPEKDRRPKSVRVHTRRLIEQVRNDPDPDFQLRVLPVLRQKIENFDERFLGFLPVINDIYEARKEIYETGKRDRLNALTKDYESKDGIKFNSKHPEVLMEVKDATDVIVGIFKKR